ncbi:unnamed protein product [Urochloa humidicola]
MSTAAGSAAATARTAGRWPRLRCSWLRRPLMGQDEARRVLLSAGRRHPESSGHRVRGGSALPSTGRAVAGGRLRRSRTRSAEPSAPEKAAGLVPAALLTCPRAVVPRRSSPRPAAELAVPPSLLCRRRASCRWALCAPGTLGEWKREEEVWWREFSRETEHLILLGERVRGAWWRDGSGAEQLNQSERIV